MIRKAKRVFPRGFYFAVVLSYDKKTTTVSLKAGFVHLNGGEKLENNWEIRRLLDSHWPTRAKGSQLTHGGACEFSIPLGRASSKEWDDWQDNSNNLFSPLNAYQQMLISAGVETQNTLAISWNDIHGMFCRDAVCPKSCDDNCFIAVFPLGELEPHLLCGRCGSRVDFMFDSQDQSEGSEGFDALEEASLTENG